MRKIRKKIKIEFTCDKCGYSSEDEEEFLRVGGFDLCWACFREYEKFIETFKGQTIENFIFEEK